MFGSDKVGNVALSAFNKRWAAGGGGLSATHGWPIKIQLCDSRSLGPLDASDTGLTVNPRADNK